MHRMSISSAMATTWLIIPLPTPRTRSDSPAITRGVGRKKVYDEMVAPTASEVCKSKYSSSGAPSCADNQNHSHLRSWIPPYGFSQFRDTAYRCARTPVVAPPFAGQPRVFESVKNRL